MRRLLGLLPLAGCAQIAGIDTTTGPASAEAVSLALDRYSMGATITTAPLDLAALSATYLIPNEADPTILDRVPALSVDPGLWAADIPTGTPSVLFTLPDYPDPYYRLYENLGRSPHGQFYDPQHLNPVAPDAASMITMNVTLDGPFALASETLQFYVGGAWSEHTFVADAPADLATTLAATFDYTTANSVNGRPLAKIAADDLPLVLEYTGGALTAAAEAPPFAQTGADTVTATMATVTRDQIIQEPVNPTSIQLRFMAGRPSVGGFNLSWGVNASPSYKVGSSLGPRLNGGAIAIDATTIDATFGNPFTTSHDWHSVFQLYASESRVYTSPVPEALNLTLSASLSETTEGTSADIDATMPAPLPVLISVNGSTISADGSEIALDPTKLVAVTFVVDKPGAQLFQLFVFEVAPNAGLTALEMLPRLLATAPNSGADQTSAHFSLPPEMFVVGKRYVLRAMAITGGFDGVADGNLTLRSLPTSTGSFDSGLFTVKAP